MFHEDVDPVLEMRGIRERQLEESGGIQGLNGRMEAERPKWEAMGFHFMTEAAFSKRIQAIQQKQQQSR